MRQITPLAPHAKEDTTLKAAYVKLAHQNSTQIVSPAIQLNVIAARRDII